MIKVTQVPNEKNFICTTMVVKSNFLRSDCSAINNTATDYQK